MYRKDLLKPDGRKMQLYSRQPIDEKIAATNPPHDPVSPNPHLRWHPLRGEWVAYASHRQNRTFLPPKEYSPLAVTQSADFPTELPAGKYDIAVFENLFPSLSPAAHSPPELMVPTRPATGVCEVVVFTQDQDSSLSELSVEEIQLVLKVLGDRTHDVGSRPEVQYVLPFENRGVEVGVTLHHPHGQIYSYPFVPPLPARMQETQAQYLREHGRPMLQDLIADEIKDSRRILAQEEHAVAFLPVFARYPYETWIAPMRSVPSLFDLKDHETLQLARVLKTVLMKFDKMWDKPFPYLLALYQAPTDGNAHPEWHTHFEIFPPYRTRDKLKFLAGTELGAGMFVNDSFPEEKALDLRNVKIEL
jgi:UDPglucose--hexose-1-phosphate uridylyltransferase